MHACYYCYLTHAVTYAYDSDTGNMALTYQMTQGCQAAATSLTRYDTGKRFAVFR